MKDLSPPTSSSDLLTLGMDSIPINLTAASINVDLFDFKPTCSFPSVANGPEGEDDWEGQIRLEKNLSSLATIRWLTDGEGGNVELGHM